MFTISGWWYVDSYWLLKLSGSKAEQVNVIAVIYCCIKLYIGGNLGIHIDNTHRGSHGYKHFI